MAPKILVIDDNVELRDMITDLLQIKGYEVITFATGEAGLESARADQPDLIICDIAMPEMDGFSVIQHMREQPETASIPFVFLTASMTHSEENRALELADGFLSKPYKSAELFTLIDRLLE